MWQIMGDNQELVKQLVEKLVDMKVVKREEFWKLVEQYGNLEPHRPDVIEIRNKNLEEFRERMFSEKRPAEFLS